MGFQVVVILILSCLVSGCFWTKEKFSDISALHLKNGVFSQFTLEKSIAKFGLATFQFHNGSETLSVNMYTAKDAAAAERESGENIEGLLLQFRENVSPYPGAISKTIHCADEYKPKKIETGNSALVAFDLYANERFGFGVCSPDQIEYRAAVFYVRCSERFYQINYFYQKSARLASTLKILRQFYCKD